ncbi:prolyl tripeptidyl peptidase-like [Plakobranchus ocellatus]|uniref:Prolyl tripeptidyl peptidase-like n=1 Tax=Plakobranchus ocellatus TaxID=259542 RepID=A0AAV4BUT1_9GAST|nr:prolyl tripeptidyl peptidase-like [Plakobranchus ocellatus]
MEAGYGTWVSPISSKICSESSVDLVGLQVDGDTQFSDTVYWNETHFSEDGRYVICSADKSGNITEWTPQGFNARSTIHEYGGGDFIVYQGVVYFTNFSDQALYRQTSPETTPEALTDTTKAQRYADGYFDPKSERIFCVREDHEVVKNGAKEAKNEIVSVDPKTKTVSVLVDDVDFCACPRVSADGKKIAWVEWMHPNMPWDSTRVMVAELTSSGDQIVQATKTKVAGGQDSSGQDWSVIQPSWTPQGQLLYIGDQSNWWNLYLVTESGEHVNLHPVQAEIGGPQWWLGRTPYTLDPKSNGGRILTSFGGEFGIIDVKSKSYKKLETGLSSHDRYGWTAAGNMYCIGYSSAKFPQVIRVNDATGKVDVIRESMTSQIDQGYISVPQKISFPTTQGETCHGYFYPPTNKDFSAPTGELPPVLVQAHQGPTLAFVNSLDLRLQYFTSRGFAVLRVDYRGSTGYGKAYRYRLKKLWGVLDIEDCCEGVQYLRSKGLVDPKRTCIDGESAGGFATLACVTFTDTFQAGRQPLKAHSLQVWSELIAETVSDVTRLNKSVSDSHVYKAHSLQVWSELTAETVPDVTRLNKSVSDSHVYKAHSLQLWSELIAETVPDVTRLNKSVSDSHVYKAHSLQVWNELTAETVPDVTRKNKSASHSHVYKGHSLQV